MRLWIARLFLIAWFLTCVYLTLVWLPINHPPPNLVPFQTIRHDWLEGGYSFWVNLVGNVAFFLPAGLLLPWSRQRTTTFAYVAACALMVSGTIELLQFVSGRRTADVDDVVLNVAGALLGAALGAIPAALLNLFRPSARMVEKVDQPAFQAITMSRQIQQVFTFLERRLQRERRIKTTILTLTVLVLVAMLAGTTTGRYLVTRCVLAAQSRFCAPVGGGPPRDVIEAETHARRAFGIEATRELVRQVYQESDPKTAEVFRYAAMTPDDAVLRWGNFNGTFLLSSRVFEPDDTGRSYRLRPHVASVWLGLGALPRGIAGYFLVPDGPELKALSQRIGVAIVPGTAQTTNSWGCRGPEPDPKADVRVIVLGDSMMQGLMVGDDETPPIFLEHELRARLGGTVSVLNTGTLGYSTEQYYYTLMQFLDRFRPHYIVVSLCGNDFPDDDDGWNEALYWLDRIEQECRTTGRVCLVVPAPVDSQVAGSRSSNSFQSRMEQHLATPGTCYCNPIEEFVEENLRLFIAAQRAGRPTGTSPLYNGHLNDHHFSPLGSALWAKIVARRLILLRERAQTKTIGAQTSKQKDVFTSPSDRP